MKQKFLFKHFLSFIRGPWTTLLPRKYLCMCPWGTIFYCHIVTKTNRFYNKHIFWEWYFQGNHISNENIFKNMAKRNFLSPIGTMFLLLSVINGKTIFSYRTIFITVCDIIRPGNLIVQYLFLSRWYEK